MEAITIHLDEGHESRVIQTYTPHGAIRQMTIAELDTKSKEMRITSIYPQSTSETVVLTEEAMQNLVRFYGAETNDRARFNQIYADNLAKITELHEEVAAQKDAWHEVNRDAICLRAENEALRAQLAQMQSQESFRMALLESVVSAARVYSQDGNYDLFSDLDAALEALDEWQPRQPEATPAAPAEDVPNPDEDLEQYERDKAEVQA